MRKINEAFTPEESKKIYDNFLAIVNDSKRRNKLVKKHGSNAEAVAYGTAVNQVKKKSSKNKEEEDMESEKNLKEIIQKILAEKSLKKSNKSPLEEYTSDNLQVITPKLPPRDIFESILPETFSTVDEAYNRIKQYANKRMFVHVQYHVVEPLENSYQNKTRYMFNQEQYWLRDEDVDVTLLTITFIGGEGEDERIGQAYVDTKVFLNELKDNFNVIEKVQ